MRILLVEDEPKVARALAKGLREDAYAVDHAADGEDALFLAQAHEYDLIILDVLLPKLDGFGVLRELRRRGRKVRVLMLTARDALEDRVRGLDSGADDYLTKPFSFAELLARVRALLRREIRPEPAELRIANLTLDLPSHRVVRDGRRISLTVKEFAVLAFLMRHPDEVISRGKLAAHVWDENFDAGSNVIDVTVYHLREKVDRDFAPALIHTIRGAGYVLSPDPRRR